MIRGATILLLALLILNGCDNTDPTDSSEQTGIIMVNQSPDVSLPWFRRHLQALI